MPTILKDDDTITAPAGTPMRVVGEKLDIPFGCETGICGTCEVIVRTGNAFLTPLSPGEVEMGLAEDEEDYRLLCQCSLRHDTPEDAVITLEE